MQIQRCFDAELYSDREKLKLQNQVSNSKPAFVEKRKKRKREMQSWIWNGSYDRDWYGGKACTPLHRWTTFRNRIKMTLLHMQLQQQVLLVIGVLNADFRMENRCERDVGIVEWGWECRYYIICIYEREYRTWVSRDVKHNAPEKVVIHWK